MEIEPLLSNGASTPLPADSDQGTTAITSDFDTFLRMLTVQLQNQDPLNPIESSDYAVQLATFSGVEQQVQTNELLRAMTSQQAADGLAQLAGWVGMEARTTEPVAFTGGPVTLDVDPDAFAEAAELIVYDDRDIEMQRLTLVPGQTSFEWSGVGTNGEMLPDGNYRFDVVSYALGQEIGRGPASSYSLVTEVQSVDGLNQLVLSSGHRVATSAVTAVRDPALN